MTLTMKLFLAALVAIETGLHVNCALTVGPPTTAQVLDVGLATIRLFVSVEILMLLPYIEEKAGRAHAGMLAVLGLLNMHDALIQLIAAFHVA